ncbi:hypothetical protein TESG_00255 [Trichophyton tonsurans CBS 112818]|uniref:Uncharacterized protein n=1 Tax=Trichophyton tonsurans (strain CBS 112818) TaxID=647933 RepID=F2RMY4_TRIT1|nr:hypothetical protein TESG_00255 [Trichophyton tonsurans CBS 112818]
MVTWDKANIERLVAALLAAHPGFTPDYSTMAVYFGQGATYDAIHGQFRRFRQDANKMRGSASGTVPSTPSRRRNAASSTPRSGRGAITKSASAKKSNYNNSNMETPTKKRELKMDSNKDDPIILDDDEEDVTTPLVKHEMSEVKHENPVIKEEAKAGEVISMTDIFSAAASADNEGPQREIAATGKSPATASPSDTPHMRDEGRLSMPLPPNRVLYFNYDDDEDIIV